MLIAALRTYLTSQAGTACSILRYCVGPTIKYLFACALLCSLIDVMLKRLLTTEARVFSFNDTENSKPALSL